LSDPSHPEHPHDEEEFIPEMPFEMEGGEDAHAAHEAHPGEEQHPFDALGIHASTDEFHFSGPAEELDFTEPTDFSFPTAHEAEAVSESSTNLGAAAEHAVTEEHFGGGEETTEFHMPSGEESAAEGEAAEAEAVADLDLEEEAAEKPKREVPAWMHTLVWTMVGLLGAGSLIAILVSIGYVQDPDMVTLILNIGCPVMLGLIPLSLWWSSKRWTQPAVSAVYTVMLALCVAALIGGTWAQGMELSHYRWHFNKTRVSTDKPKPGYIPAPPPAPKEAK
jgi:hypothetical protein